MVDQTKYIGLDIGAQSGRCFVGTLKDTRIELDEVYRFITPTINSNNGFYWDISSIVGEIFKGLSTAAKKYGPVFNGIGIDTWGVDYVLIDELGKPLNDPYHYRDHRTDSIFETVFDILPAEELYKITGNKAAQFNTLFQLVAEKKNAASNLHKAEKLLLMPDYLKFVLTGKIKTEYTIASTTNLLDSKTKNWSEELIKIFGFPKELFPDIVQPGDILGKLKPDISRFTGISTETPVISTAGHDTACAVVSIPVEEEHFAFLSSGTWSILGMEINNPLLTKEAFDYDFSNEGGFGNKIRLLKNIIGLWPLQECKRIWDSERINLSYCELIKSARAAGPAEFLININDPKFLGSENMPELIISSLSNNKEINKPAPAFITRVILESLAHSYSETVESLKVVTGKAIDNLYVVGGGIKNEFLNQLTADATGVNLIAGPVEGTIAGNIGVQAIATGFVTGIKNWRQIVRNSFKLNTYYPENK